MRDCPSGEFRDLLPDLVHERLGREAHADVSSHVADCPDCAEEVALLRRIRAAAESGRVPAVNVERVVSALPRAGRRAPRWTRSAGLRIAAGLVALVAGAAWLQQSRNDNAAGGAPQQAVVVAQAPARARDSSGAAVTTLAVTPRTTTTARVARVSLDDGLSDLTDGELKSLLADLDSFEAVTAVEPSALEPILDSERQQ
jgi:anti-sigma factor RsiW